MCLRELGRKDEAEDAYRSLLERNADNLAFYSGFLLNRGVDLGPSPSPPPSPRGVQR